MEKIFEQIEKINKNIEIKNKKVEIFDCYFCKGKNTDNCLDINLFIDGKQVYVCEKCINEDECKKFNYCHNCEIDIDSNACSYYCNECPDDINVLCSKCNKLHDLLIKVTHNCIKKH
jgi:hypothetical protein